MMFGGAANRLPADSEQIAPSASNSRLKFMPSISQM